MFFGKKTASSPNTSTPSNGKHTVSLTKSKESLDRSIVNLTKSTGVNLDKHTARVCVVMDKSGSMYNLYSNGSVQKVLSRLLPIALKFDDNGELEVFLFNNSCHQLPSMNIDNYESYVEKEIMRKGYGPTGGTSYAPPIKQTMSYYDDGSRIPAFVIFITDGENSDQFQTDSAIRDSSKLPIFYQFVGIGYESFDYLRKLDDLSGRKVDNTAFVKVTDFSRMSDDELYSKLLEQYPQWLKDMNLS